MKAAILNESERSLRIQEVPRPTPAADEVLLQVEACGVCHSDLHIIQNDWPDARPGAYPAILGHEVVGKVVDAGASVKNLEPGTRVGVGWLCWTCGMCEPCTEGHENLCLERAVTGLSTPGGYAEYMCAKASHVVPVPDELPPHHAAPLFCAGVTMYRACRAAQIAPDQNVVVFGIGGLGHLGVQFAKRFGATVTAVEVSEERLDFARAVGADRLVHVSSSSAIVDLSAHGGHHVALVTAPSQEAYEMALRSLRYRGTLAVVGLPKQHLVISADEIATGEYCIIGSAVGTREDLADVLRMVADEHIRCEVKTYDLEELPEVLDRLREGKILGRAVITFGS